MSSEQVPTAAPIDAPASAKPHKKRGCLRIGCVVALLLMLGFCGFLGWWTTLASRLAAAEREEVRLGSSLRDVVAAVDRYWMATAQECSGGVDSFKILSPSLEPSGDVLVTRASEAPENLRFSNKAELLNQLEARPPLLSCRRLRFTFRGAGSPLTVMFTVEFDENGRASRVTELDSFD